MALNITNTVVTPRITKHDQPLVEAAGSLKPGVGTSGRDLTVPLGGQHPCGVQNTTCCQSAENVEFAQKTHEAIFPRIKSRLRSGSRGRPYSVLKNAGTRGKSERLWPGIGGGMPQKQTIRERLFLLSAAGTRRLAQLQDQCAKCKIGRNLYPAGRKV